MAALHSVNFSQNDFFLATTITLAEGPVYIHIILYVSKYKTCAVFF